MAPEAENELLNTPGELDLNKFKPEWYAGAWKAPFTGLASVVSDASLLGLDGVAALNRTVYAPVDYVFGTDFAESTSRDVRDKALRFSQWTAPDPRSSGILAQYIHGFFNVVPEAFAGPAVAGVLQGYKATRMAAAEGVDEGTAAGLGLITGATTWAGMKLPNVLAPRLSWGVNAALSASANAGVGIVSRGATGEYLKAAGYPEMAKQYEALDSTAIVADLILGAGFGGVESYLTHRSQAQRQAAIDAAMAVVEQVHRDLETAPGVPLDPATRQAHADYMLRLMEAELNGEDLPPPPPELVNGNFLEDPALRAAREEIGVAVRRHLGELGTLEDELAARGLPTDPELYSVVPNNRSVLERDPIMQDAAQRLKAGEITGEEYRRIADERKPVLPYQRVPEPATDADLQRGLTSDKQDRINAPSSLAEGTPVGLRLDIPAYSQHGVWAVSVHEQQAGFAAGKSIGYSSTAAATDVTLGVQQTGAINVATGKPKAPFAVMKGNWKPMTPAAAKALADRALNDPAWRQIGMDPTRRAFFYDRKTMQPIVAADEVVQIGPLVLGKNVKYGEASDHLFSVVGEPAARIAQRVSERPPVRFTDRVRGLLDQWAKDGDTGKLLDELIRLDSDLETRAAVNEAKRGAEPVRGELWVRERFMRAERNGEISPQAHALVKWLLDKNPALATDLALSFKSKGKDAGSYNPAQRLATIFTNRSNDLTAVHEVLHHIERMLPENVRTAIRRGWLDDLSSQYELAKEAGDDARVAALDDAIRAASGDLEAFNRIADQIRKGELPPDFYQYVNPSEWWAENASILVQERAGREGWVAELKQWMKEFLQKVQEVFGISSKATIIRGLDAALESDGAIRGRMLLDLVSVREMKRETKGDLLQPGWHGSPHRFRRFSLDFIGKGVGAQRYGWGLYFSGGRNVAQSFYNDFTSGPNTAQLYRVEIPDHAVARMLRFDKRLSEQPENVKEGIRQIIDDPNLDPEVREFFEDATDPLGSTIYSMLASSDGFKGDGQREASLLLAEHGIPGNEYYDGYNPDTGAGPYNYVIWDDAVIQEMNDSVETFYSVTRNRRNEDDVRPEQAGDGGRRYSGRGLAPLDGAPQVRGGGPIPELVAVAERFAAEHGIPLRRQAEYVRVDEERARRIAKAYEDMPHAPNDPAVREAYENLVRQTTAQYRALEAAGYKFWFFDESNDPYAGNPWNAMRDLRDNRTMAVFATEAGYGDGKGAGDYDVADNPLLADTGIMWPYGSLDGPKKRVLANDLFRAVHDTFGHGLEGAGFRAQGEENAWQAHVRLFTGSAVGAITSETRGQNSWLNYGPHGEKNRTARVEDTIFADQKTGLMPEWTWSEGIADDMTDEPVLLSVVPEAPGTAVSRLLRRSAEQENRTGVIVGGRPGEFGWSFTQRDVMPSPVQHPVVRGPRLEKIAPLVREVLESPAFRKLVKDLFGIKDLTVRQIEGTWKGSPEPSYVLYSKSMTAEQANKLGRLLGFAFTQDSVIVTKHSPNLAEGRSTLYIGTGKKLTPEQVNAIMNAARERGLDLSTSADGTAVKFTHFGEEADLSEFMQKVGDIAKITGTNPPVHVRTEGNQHNAEKYLHGESGTDGAGDGLFDSERDRPALLRRVFDSLVVPYAKAVGAEGYRLSPELFGKRFGLSDAEVELLTDRLRPSESEPRSTVKLMTGEEKLDIQPTGKMGKANITDVMWALQNRAAKLGFILPGDYSPQAMKVIGRAIVDEVAYHVKHAAKSAIGWYDSALKEAKNEYDKILPEIKREPNKGMVFDAILGITSQGNDVFNNSIFAVRVFQLVKDGSYTISEAVKILGNTFGDKTAQIEYNLLKLEHLIKVNGYDRMRSLFNTKMTVSEWNAMLRRDSSLRGHDGEKLEVEGQADQLVTGWMVFGPKIGSFINNLHGDYTTLTADLWFSRTWNRLLGFMFTHSPILEAKQYQEFKDAMQAEYYRSTEAKTQNGKPVMKKGKPMPWENGNDITHLTPDEFESLLNDPEKLLALANQLESVYRKTGYKQKTDLRRRAKNWIESREGVQEAPRADLERSFQQQTVEWAQKELRKQGLDITVADIQAALWFHEKEMFANFGVASKKAKPADYADAARVTVEKYLKGELYWVESDGKYIGGLDGKYLGTRVPDGNGGLVAAGKLIEQADAEVVTAERESPKFEEAVQCELRG